MDIPPFMQPLPPEEVQKMMDRAYATNLERVNRYFRLLEEMKPADLATLREMLTVTLSIETPSQFVSQTIGQIDAIMRLKHGDHCGGCGHVHDLEVIEDEKARMASEVSQAIDEAATEAAMKEYGVVRQDDGTLACRDCGVPIFSLEDRMLKPPGTAGCSSCVQKQKWG